MQNGHEFNNKPVALITGGARGLGSEIAIQLSLRGYATAIHYFQSDREANRLRERLGDKTISIHHADLRNVKACENLVQSVIQTMGRLDVLVNNASLLHRTSPGELSEDIWMETMALNLRSVAFLSMYGAKAMQESDGGSILNIGDLAGLEPWPAYLAHAVSKAGVHHLTRCMALAYAPEITVNAIAPGLLEAPPGWTEQRKNRLADRIPGGRPAKLSEVAALAVDLVGNPSITGQIIAVDRGQSLSF